MDGLMNEWMKGIDKSKVGLDWLSNLIHRWSFGSQFNIMAKFFLQPGYSCRLLTDEMAEVFVIEGEDKQTVRESLELSRYDSIVASIKLGHFQSLFFQILSNCQQLTAVCFELSNPAQNIFQSPLKDIRQVSRTWVLFSLKVDRWYFQIEN